MKITICGSIGVYDLMVSMDDLLAKQGHEVKLPPAFVKDEGGKDIPVGEYYRVRKAAGDDDAWIWDRKAEAIHSHFGKVVWADAILVANAPKNGVEGYIGSNTFHEMGLAFHLRKPIYLWGIIPFLPCREEILAMKPMLLYGNLERL